MSKTCDILIIGGGVAGLSAAARLCRHGKVIVLEGEGAIGYHSSGRSATWSHLGIGNDPVRELTTASAAMFDEIADDLILPSPAIFIADEETHGELAILKSTMADFSSRIVDVPLSQLRELVPVLRIDDGHIVGAVADEGAFRIDSQAMLDGFTRAIRAQGGQIEVNQSVIEIKREGSGWIVRTAGGDYSADTIVNAAGAWADDIARLAGLKAMGLQPLRRTIIGFAPPENVAIANWPFVKSVVDDFYMLPQSGLLLASPVDEVPSEPCDAVPEEYDIALAAWRVEQWTQLQVKRIATHWAGLRTFSPDRVPIVGRDAVEPSFIWLVGQGGYGLQTAPAMARICEAAFLHTADVFSDPGIGVNPTALLPGRFT